MFLSKIDIDILTERGYLKNDITCICLGFESILGEEYLEYNKNEEESINEKHLYK